MQKYNIYKNVNEKNNSLIFIIYFVFSCIIEITICIQNYYCKWFENFTNHILSENTKKKKVYSK